MKNLILSNKELLRVILAVCLLVVGILHFVLPEPFIKIVPPVFLYPAAMVYISGFFEILGAIGLLFPPVSRLAAWGLVSLFIAVYPANLYMAIHHIHIPNIPVSNTFQAIRLPLQFVLIAWAWWYTRADDNPNQASIIPGYPKVNE